MALARFNCSASAIQATIMTIHDDDDVSWDRVSTETVQIHQTDAAQEECFAETSSTDDPNNDAVVAAVDGSSSIPAKLKERKTSPRANLLKFWSRVFMIISLICAMKAYEADQNSTSVS